MSWTSACVTVGLAIAMGASPVWAAEVTLLSAAVLKPAITELAPLFERATGHTLAVTYESAGVVRKRVEDGDTADVAIIQKPAVEALARQGKIVPTSAVTLARSGVAVAVSAGRAEPDTASTGAPTPPPLAPPPAAHPP